MKHLYQSLLLLLALLLPATATAYDFEVDGIYYNINGDVVSVTHSGYHGWDYGSANTYSGDVAIPATTTYNGLAYPVTSIGGNAFYGCTGLTSVTIPNSVVTIGSGAFSGCTGLTSVTIPNSVTGIGYEVFYGCSGLTSITIPNSVPFIEAGMFKGCSGLTSVAIPNSVTGIGYEAFNGCSSLTSITIPNSVTSVGFNAFNGCSALSSITIPESITYVGEFAFEGTAWIENHPNGVIYVGLVAYGLKGTEKNIVIKDGTVSIADYAFMDCGMTNISIPNTVTYIGENAFHHTGLTSVTIPSSVTDIKYKAFTNCPQLQTVFFNAIDCNTVIWSGGPAGLFDYSPIEKFVIGNHVKRIPLLFVEGSRSSLKTIVIGDSVQYINGEFVSEVGEIPPFTGFGECDGLTDVYSYILDPTDAWKYEWILDSGDYSNRTLHVPVGSLETYQADENWYPYFERIVAMDPVSITLDKTTAVIIENESLQLTATVMPDCTYNKTVAWSSSNAAVATVDDDGLVTAHSVGTATITAMTTDGSNLSASCVVTVKSLSATECLSMPDGEVLHGEAITIPVRMTNAATVLAFQTDIFLPEGFTIDTNEDNEPIVTPSSRLTDDHIIMTQVANNGAVRVVCYTPTMQPISGNEGDLFYITVNVPADAAGDYAVYLRNSRLTIDDFTEVRIPDAGAVIDVKTYIPGDVNDTHSVNVADIVTTVRYVLDMDPSPFIFDAADMNGDGEVTVTDIMLIARQILYPTMNAPRQAPAYAVNGDRMSGEGITLTAGETRTVSINLDNALDYSAFQLDLRLPEGLTATNFRLTERTASHALEVNTLRNGNIRALCYTPAIEAIDGNNGAVLTFDVTAKGAVTGDITVDDIELVTTACQGVHFDAFTIGVQTATAVTELSSGKTVAKVEYFNLAGQRLTRPATDVTLIVTTYTDGTRTTTKRLD